MEINRKDLATGLIFVAFAAVYGYMSLNTMAVGTPTQMGPGFFPATLATVVFAAFVDDLGMLPGTFVTTMITCLASPRIPLWQNLVISVCLAAFCSLVFSVGLGVPLPILGTLFRA